MKTIIFLLTIVITGCASTPPYRSAKINGKYDVIGASVYSPNQGNWYLIQHSPTILALGNIGPNNESTVAAVNIFQVGSFEQDRDFLDAIIAERAKNENTQRWRNQAIANTFTKFKGSSCFSYKGIAEDHQSKSKSTKQFQYYQTIGIICRHPDNHTTAIQAEVSYRADSKEMPLIITETAQRFMNSLDFNNNPAHE